MKRSAEMKRISEAEAPWPVHRFRNADPGPDNDCLGHPIRWPRQLDLAGGMEKIDAIKIEADAQRLAELARTRAEIRDLVASAAMRHQVDAGRGLNGANEDGGSAARRTDDDVGADVNAVDQVAVEKPGGAEHGGVSSGLATKGVGRRVIGLVGLNFDDPTRGIGGRQLPSE